MVAASTLNFFIQKQLEKNLCWAAVASSVSKLYDPNSPYSICKVASEVKNIPSCCTNIGPCDKQEALSKALTITGNGSAPIQGMPSFDIIKNELMNNHVICLRVEWRGTDCGGGLCGHFIVIYGFHDGETVDVADPWPGFDPGKLSLAELQDFYKNTGQITHYYKTKDF